ncbi:MAG: spore germination protein [Bacillota bacterium]
MRRRPARKEMIKPHKVNERLTEPEQNGLNTHLRQNLDIFKKRIGTSTDVVFREFTVGLERVPAAVLFVDGLVDKDVINSHILRAMMMDWSQVEAVKSHQESPPSVKVGTEGQEREQGQAPSRMSAVELLKRQAMTAGEVSEKESIEEIILAALSGDAIFLLEGSAIALVVSARGWASRGIEEPPSESLVRGPRDGFTESIRTNTALLRRKLRDPRLVITSSKVGRRSQTDLAVAYVEDLVNQDVLRKVKERLQTIDIDSVLESGYIEQLIEDSYLSPFPQVQYSERPDKVAAALVEGRVALILDGTPFVLIVPASFGQFFQSPEDYYERWIIGSLARILRILASYVATFTPALYVALTSYHPGLLPTQLAIAIAASREGIPYPAALEMLMLEVAFELFREAGARLPRAIGQTVGIVGGIIIGTAAVQAGLASNIVVIVVSITAIASFSIPNYNMAIGFRMLRFPLLLLASVLGIYGIMLGFVVINIHMVTMKSFGVIYLSPIVPYRPKDYKDLFIRAPIRAMHRRPEFLGSPDIDRQDNRKREGW